MNRKIALFLSSTALGGVMALESHGAPGFGPSGNVSATPGGGQFFYPVPQQQQPPLQPIGSFMAPRPQAGGLAPAFSYGQQQAQAPQQRGQASPLVAQAGLIMADWTQNKNRYDKINPKTVPFDTAYQKIEGARNKLIAALPYLTPDKYSQARQVMWLLKLIQLKVLLQEMTVLKTNMPYLMNDVVQKNNENQTRPIDGLGKDPIGVDWIKDKRATLQQIMTDFNTKLFSLPNFVNNIPTQLEGIDVTFNKATAMRTYLDQQIGCFSNPDPSICPFKAAPKQKQKVDQYGRAIPSNNPRDDDDYDQQDFDDGDQ